MKNSFVGLAFLASAVAAVAAQGGPKPTCNMCPGT